MSAVLVRYVAMLYSAEPHLPRTQRPNTGAHVPQVTWSMARMCAVAGAAEQIGENFFREWAGIFTARGGGRNLLFFVDRCP